MDSIDNMWSGNKRLSLRRSIVGSIKRSLSPLSKNSNSPTASQTSCGSIELAQHNSSSQKDQVTPTPVQSLSDRFKKSNPLSRNSGVAIGLEEYGYSQKAQLSSNNVQTGNSRTSKSSSVFPGNRVSMQSIYDIPSQKKTLPIRTASTASKIRKSLSTSFFADNTHPIQALKDIPVQEIQQLLPGQTKSSASTRLPKKLYPTLITRNNRSSIRSIQELPSLEKDASLPARSSSTSGRYSTMVWPSSKNNQTTPKSEQSTSATKRSSIVSFQIPEVVQVKSPQSDVLFTVQPLSNASKSNRSSWLSVSRTSSTKSRKQSQLATLQRLGLGGGREPSVSQRQYDTSTAKETTLPWDPAFNRDWDFIACDGIRSDPNRVFENFLLPQRNNYSSLLFNMPIKLRRKVYSYCLPKKQNTTVSLSPHFATKNCYYGYHFTSPWDILQPVAGGLQSFSLMRNDLMTYFWTEYDFHVTLTPFCNSVFTPLSSVWLPNFLDRIQHLTIEIDLTRFGGNALKFARNFGYNMEKMDNIFCAVINGLVERRGEMAELVLLCRRFDGNRRFDENDSTWKAGESFEYFPEESMQFCDAIINLRGTVKSIRIAGFPIDVTKDWLNCIFADGEKSCQMTIPNVSAWPPLPPLFSGLRQAPNLYAAPMAPISPELSNYRESHKTQWQCEASVYSVERPEDDAESPVRLDTSLSVTTVGDPVKLYQDHLPAITLSGTSHGSVEPLSDPTKTPTKTAALTYQVMAAEDHSNSKRHIKKPNPRNSRDFSPGQFYYQPLDASESELISQGQKSDPEKMNPIRQSPISNWNGQKANGAESHRTSSSEKDNSLPKTPISMSKRKSQFSERQMPDIPESPLNPNRPNLRTEAPVIRPGTLKATSDAHLLRIRSHISKSISTESSDEHPSLPPPSQTFKPETSGSINDRTIICTPSRKSESKVSKDCRGDPSPTRPFQQAVNHDIQHFADDNSIDRRLPRTPSPNARPKAVLVTSPDTLNKINEQDPKFLKSIRGLQSACTSTESVIRAPDQTYRPTSLASPLIHSDTRPKRSGTDQSANSGESDLKRSKFAAWFRRSN